jgi:hypothetical protein
MRRAVVRTIVLSLLVSGACEIQPAPKKQPAPVVEPPARPPTPPPAVDDAGVADAIAPPIIQASPACINVAAHVVQVFIDTAKDPAQAAVYEQERMKMTRLTAEACQTQGWSEAAQKCYTAAKDPPGIKACENKFPPTPPPRTGSGSATGSAAPSGAGSAAPTGAGSAAPSAGPGQLRPEGAKGTGANAGSAAPPAHGTTRPKAAGSAAR